MYIRKSTDSEDRQVQSIEDQLKALRKLAKEKSLEVVKVFKENASAKNPGRSEFNKMIEMIRQGKAKGIICWKPNRLSRNPLDGAQIQWLLQKGNLMSIQTPGREHRTGENTILLTVELGMANQYSIDLGVDVKRGLTSKAEKGWRPGLAPIGYLNDKQAIKGEKRILTDPEKFPLVRELWDMMLTGKYSVTDIQRHANEKLGLKTYFHSRYKELSLTHTYRIFQNTFYYGEYTYSGEVYVGLHEPMITPSEFDRVQTILGDKGRPRAKNKRLPLSGLVKCGDCGCSIVPDEKIKFVKSLGAYKSYIYFRCTKKKPGVKCGQKSVSYQKIQEQILNRLDEIYLPPEFLKHALEVLRRDNELEADKAEIIHRTQQKNLTECERRISNLLKLYISQENEDREFLSEAEYKEQKSILTKEKLRLIGEMQALNDGQSERLVLTEQAFEFTAYAKQHFIDGDNETKTAILRALGTKFTLYGSSVNIEVCEAYEAIGKFLNTVRICLRRVELHPITSVEPSTVHLDVIRELVSG